MRARLCREAGAGFGAVDLQGVGAPACPVFGRRQRQGLRRDETLARAPVGSIVIYRLFGQWRLAGRKRQGDYKMSESPSGLPAADRRAFLWGAAVVTAVPIITEGGLAQARLSAAGLGVPGPNAVIINANENPL